MTDNIVILDLWTDANRGDNSLQVGLIKMLKKKYPGAKISGVFRFGNNELAEAKHEISYTIAHLDSVHGGLRPTCYAKERANKALVFRKIHSLFSFIILFAILFFNRLGFSLMFGKSTRSTIRALKEADLIVWKGKNFRAEQNFSGLQRLLTLCIAGLTASSFDSKLICVNASFWKIDGKLQRLICQRAFQTAKVITVRDISSEINAKSILPTKEVKYRKDLSFFDIYERLTELNLNSEEKNFDLALTITDWGSEKEKTNYINALRFVLSKNIEVNPDFRIIIIPQVIRVAESSSSVLERVVEGFDQNVVVGNHLTSIEDLLICYSQCRLLIGTRMHSCVFAAAVKTPFVAIAYDSGPKWEILEDLAERRFIIDLADISSEILYDISNEAKLKDFDLKSLALEAERNVE